MKRTLLILSVFLLTAFQSVMAQRTVTGVVTSADDGEPIFGANVVEEETTNGTTTDFEGNFSLVVSDTAENLVFTYVGLQRQILPIDTAAAMNVVMQVDENVFDDVVITAIAIQREKSSLGYATTTVDNEAITRAADRSPIEALRGKVSGVNISSTSGDPGASTRIVLRGGSSILGNNQALIVVDGVPIDNSNFGAGTDLNAQADVLNNNFDAGSRANDLNPQDIESITVLKGPAAAALYGSRAANGALIITTKSGQKTARGTKQFKVSVNSNFTFSNILKYPEFQDEYGQGGGKFPDSRENWSWGPKYDDQIRPWGQEVLIDGVPRRKVKPYSALPNNVREFFDVGRTYNNNVSIEGGTDKASYYLSYNSFINKGVIPTTGYDRNSLRFNVAYNFSEKLSSTATFSYVKTQGDLVLQGQGDYSVYNQVLQTPRDISLLELKDLTDPFNQPETYYGAYTINPWYVLENQKITNNVDRFSSTTSLTYAPVKWLDFTGRFGADVYTDSRFEKLAKFEYDNQGFHYQNVGRYAEDIYRSNIYNSDIIVSAGHQFDFGLGIDALVGNNIFSTSLKNTYARTAGLNIEDFYNLANSVDRPITDNTLSERRTVGVYGDLGLNYKKFVYLNFTARNDWSSTLPEDDRSYFYPSVNASFVLTEVVDIAPKILSYAKIRAGFAKAGSGGEDPYQLKNVYSESIIEDGFFESEIRQPYPSGPGSDQLVGAYTVSNFLRNPQLRPEQVTSWEVGTELSFWGDRLNIDFTYYNSESKDLILTESEIAPSSGYQYSVINAGSQVNKGVELAVGFIPVSLKNGFKWEIYGTFTRNRNEVTDLPEGVEQISLGGLSDLLIVAREGEPYGTFYGITALRDPQGRVVVDTSGPTTGQPIMNDEPQLLGSYQPDWFGSLGTSLSWKGLKFTILFDTRQGGKIWSRTMDLQEFLGTSPNTLNNDREDFIVPNSVVATSDGGYAENTSFHADHQDYWTIYNNADRGAHLLPASFTKLREISISYSLPAKVMKKTKYIAGIEFRVYGNNLALWTPKENTFIDPETSSYGTGNAQGFEYGTTPSLRSWGFGLKVDF